MKRLSLFMFAFTFAAMFFANVGSVRAQLSDKRFPALNEVVAIADDFFQLLEKADVNTAMKRLFAIFPIKTEAQNSFINDVTNMKMKLGTPTEHQFVGYRPMASTDRYLVTYFLTFHARMPVAWELIFYKPAPQAPWQLNYVRFDADDIPEFLLFTKLQLEALRKQAAAADMPQETTNEHISMPPAAEPVLQPLENPTVTPSPMLPSVNETPIPIQLSSPNVQPPPESTSTSSNDTFIPNTAPSVSSASSSPAQQ